MAILIIYGAKEKAGYRISEGVSVKRVNVK
jgi:hypothetical protein